MNMSQPYRRELIFLLCLSLLVTGALATDAPTITVLPADNALDVGETTTVAVLLATMPTGLSGFNITVALTDPSVGELTAITYPSWAVMPENSSLPADTVYAQAVDLMGSVGAGATNVTLCTLTVRGDATGTTNLTITTMKIDDDVGGRYAPETTDALLIVDSLPAPVANFTANVTSGPAPLTVQFTNTSTGNPTSWSWTFGNGATSTEQHPTHTYTATGTYTVNLTVSNDNDSDTLSRPGYITVTRVKGDFNGNGAVDIGDVSNVAYMVVGKTPADPGADFNENGAVDIGDAAKIAYYFVGKIPTL